MSSCTYHVVLACLVLMGTAASESSNLEGTEEISVAHENVAEFAGRWKEYWGSQYKFIDTAGAEASLGSVLSSCQYKATVVALLGNEKPTRRNVSGGQPFIEIRNEPQTNVLSSHSTPLDNEEAESALETSPKLSNVLGLSSLNEGVQAIESTLGRYLFPFRLNFMPFPESTGDCRKPYAVWNVSNGEIYLDQQLVSRMGSSIGQVQSISGQFAANLTAQIGKFIPQAVQSNSLEGIWKVLVDTVLPVALMMAVGSQIPLWFCIACPVVLGLLAPFIFNAGFGEAAEAICTHYQLSAQECNDLWYGAFAAAMVLSFASAIPIVYICQLPKCGRGRAI